MAKKNYMEIKKTTPHLTYIKTEQGGDFEFGEVIIIFKKEKLNLPVNQNTPIVKGVFLELYNQPSFFQEKEEDIIIGKINNNIKIIKRKNGNYCILYNNENLIFDQFLPDWLCV